MSSKRSLRDIIKKEALHFTAGTGVGLALAVLPRLLVLIIVGAATLVMIVFELARFVNPSLNLRFAAWLPFLVRKGEEKKVTGTTYFLIASVTVALAFPAYIAVAAILFAALGDPTATVVGSLIGKTRFWGKSLEGHLACLAICLAIGFLLVRASVEPSFTMVVIGAVAATIFQAMSLPLNDNVTITWGSAVVMWAVSISPLF